jgi:hypothetical protein
MIGVEHIEAWRGQPVIDREDEQLGKLEDVYFDRGSGAPLLLAVKSGLLGRKTKLIPVDGALVGPDYVRVVHDKAAVDGAPDASGGDLPGSEELDALGAAYGLRFADKVELDSVSGAEARREEAKAARERAAQLTQEAEEARRAAAEAHADARSYEDE